MSFKEEKKYSYTSINGKKINKPCCDDIDLTQMFKKKGKQIMFQKHICPHEAILKKSNDIFRVSVVIVKNLGYLLVRGNHGKFDLSRY